jgi:ubiquinone/menaquinone biosynthesis C-methylase UbiE
MNSFEKSEQPKKSVGGEHLGDEYYDAYDSLFDLEMMMSRMQSIHLPEEIDNNLKQQESNTFLVLGSATTKNINGVTKIVHSLHGKENTQKDLVTIVDINDASLSRHQKAVQELDEVSDWTKTSIREESRQLFPYPEFKVEKGDIRSLSQESDSIDVALSDYTVNYLDSEKDVRAFFNEVNRVLREKGIFYIAFRYSRNNQSEERISQGGTEICTFSLDNYKQWAEEAGLRIVATDNREDAGDTLIVFGKSLVTAQK